MSEQEWRLEDAEIEVLIEGDEALVDCRDAADTQARKLMVLMWPDIEIAKQVSCLWESTDLTPENTHAIMVGMRNLREAVARLEALHIRV